MNYHETVRKNIRRETTIFPTTTTRGYLVPPEEIVGFHNGVDLFYTGDTYHIIEDMDGRYYVATTTCYYKDEFSRKTGHNVSKGLAEKIMAIVHGILKEKIDKEGAPIPFPPIAQLPYELPDGTTVTAMRWA